jgi:hypothetical protein
MTAGESLSMGYAESYAPDEVKERAEGERRPPTVTQQLADRLRDLDPPGEIIPTIFGSIATQLERCVSGVDGWRCQLHSICPRCSARRAKRDRRRLERKLRELPIGYRVVHLTITTWATELVEGRAAFVRMFRRLRARASWRPVVAGQGQIEIEPDVRGGWNVHGHWLLAVRGVVDVAAVRRAWVEENGARSLRWDAADRARLFVPGRSRRGEPFRADRVLRHEAAAIGVAGARRRAAGRPRALPHPGQADDAEHRALADGVTS